MKKSLFGTVFAFALGTVAMSLNPAESAAADLPTKAQNVLPVYNTWTGFYVGAHAGVGWGSGGSQSITDPAAGPVFAGFDPVTFGGSAKLGAIGGIQFGYNWQATPTWLLGVEGDISFASLNNSNSKAPLTAAVGAVRKGRGVGRDPGGGRF